MQIEGRLNRDRPGCKKWQTTESGSQRDFNTCVLSRLIAMRRRIILSYFPCLSQNYVRKTATERIGMGYLFAYYEISRVNKK